MSGNATNDREETVDRLRDVLYANYRSRFVDYRSGKPSAHTTDWKRRVFVPLLNSLPHTASIVELGCGAGELLEVINSAGFKNARGIDLSSEQVEAAQRRGVDAVLGDAIEYLPDLHERVDCIIAVDVLEHMTKDELAVLMPLIHGALTPNGRLIVQTVNIAGISGTRVGFGDLTHMTLFTETSIEQLLCAFGFENIRVFETGPRPIGIKGVVRVALWRIFRAYPKLVRFIETGYAQKAWTENLICVANRP